MEINNVQNKIIDIQINFNTSVKSAVRKALCMPVKRVSGINSIWYVFFMWLNVAINISHPDFSTVPLSGFFSELHMKIKKQRLFFKNSRCLSQCFKIQSPNISVNENDYDCSGQKRKPE